MKGIIKAFLVALIPKRRLSVSTTLQSNGSDLLWSRTAPQ